MGGDPETEIGGIRSVLRPVGSLVSPSGNEMHLMRWGPSAIDFGYVRTMMAVDELGYDLEYVKKLMLPLELDDSWSLYVVDTDKKELLVMDPTETFEGADSMQAKHEENAVLVLRGLIRCIDEILTEWDINGANWKIRYNEGMHMSCTREQSVRTTSGSSMGTTSDQG